MKKVLLFFLLLTAKAFSQAPNSGQFELNATWKFQMLVPVPFGENSLAKAHDANPGLGFEIGLFKYENFRLGFGYSFLQYDVTNEQLIGNINKSNYSSIYGLLSYEVPVADKITLSPAIGYGAAQLLQRSGSQNFGSQDGKEFRIGVSGNYYFSKYSAVCIGIQYVHAGLDVNTVPEFEDFFSKMNQVQFAIGLQFD